ncbi:MAG: hypothetical protein QGI08_05655 [Paracoccaceae bacterium]|jgi:hypothetical protein|nr:hypothetical protein [Paracoccaceae bacterium]MDP7185190.1 hypothetical protein [Paracoccaceae bacterium]
MSLWKFLPLSAALVVAGCANQYEQCLRNNSKDLRIVDDLIRQSQATVARGYDFETLISTEFKEVVCLTAEQEQATCLVEVGSTYQSPVAVDLDAERRKLAQLLEQRKVLESRYSDAEKACRAAYPPET